MWFRGIVLSFVPLSLWGTERIKRRDHDGVMFWGEFYFSDGNCTFFLNPLHYLAVKVCSVTGPSWNGLGRPGWGPVSTSLGTLALQVWLREATLSLGVEWSCIWADCFWPSHWSAPQYIQTVECPIASFKGSVWVQFLRATPALSPPPVSEAVVVGA
jgi:hypothetical protein